MSTNTSTPVNIFEQAAKKKIRFDTVRGEITVEQLFHLPLVSDDSMSLDAIAREVNRELKAATEDSFVEVKPNPAKATLELKLELVKHVIADKQTALNAATKRASLNVERKRLLELKNAKDGEALAQLSSSDLEARLLALDEAEAELTS